MTNIRARLAAFSLVAFVVMAEAASAQTSYSLAPATDGIVSQVTSVLATVLPIAGGLLALTIGWKLLKKMTKSA
jgi:hypothetical protein